VRRALFVAPAIVLFWTSAAHAVDPFEIQVYDGTANTPGKPGLELHLNNVANGVAVSDPPELPQDRATHMTLEPSFGVLKTWEIGGYFQTALRKDGTFDYAGVKLRSKHVTSPDWNEHWRLGINFELSLLPDTYDRDRWGTELRPIAAWHDEDWLFAINPIVDVPLAGDGYWKGPTFEPAATIVRDIAGKVGVGLEYYAAFGPFSDFAPLHAQQHYFYQVVDLVSVKNLELQVGVGEGLTEASNKIVIKTIVGYAFE
jgi:hypothetical protein